MAVTLTTDSYLFLQVAENDRVVLRYHTDDCGEPCQKFIPIYDQLSEDPKYKSIIFLSVDGEQNPIAKRRILDKNQPVITVYFKGRLLDSRHTTSKEGVEELLNDLLKMD